jgi:hypothetical protein
LVNSSSKKLLKCFEGISKNDLTNCEWIYEISISVYNVSFSDWLFVC